MADPLSTDIRLYRIPEAAALLAVSKDSVYRLIAPDSFVRSLGREIEPASRRATCAPTSTTWRRSANPSASAPRSRRPPPM